MPFSFAQQHVFVAGGASGIHLGIALALRGGRDMRASYVPRDHA